jgi:oxalate decarboxylase/phosphoglucose isomerase-like protein (cupin superfamily)
MSKREIYECDMCGQDGTQAEMIDAPGVTIQGVVDNGTMIYIPGGQFHRACYVRVINDTLIPGVVPEPEEAQNA